GLERPLIGVNHLEGHIWSVLMGAGLMGAKFDPTHGDETAVNGAPRFENANTGVLRSAQDDGGGVSGQTASEPLMALVVSGGHTHLYLAETHPNGGETAVRMGHPAPGHLWRYRNVGRTVDDAAGEAFDKVAKLLGLGYPGGPWMDALAAMGDPKAVEFRFQPIRRKADPDPTHERPERSLMSGAPEGGEDARHFDFSFSGIKTAVLRYVEKHGMRPQVEVRRARLVAALKERPGLRASEAVREMPEIFDRQTLDLIASFQAAVVGNLLKQTFGAAEAWGARGVVVSGGVAANSELRRRFTAEAARRGMRVEFPAPAMSTDNAAMIAAAAWGKFAAGEFAGDGLRAQPGLRLG
ncbi:MAG TPA: hypothetical protein VG714_10880, partial [Acidobacteriaceae bacterium]|nr:hypothetical protein [Acidobacteriaceae bacterium]